MYDEYEEDFKTFVKDLMLMISYYRAFNNTKEIEKLKQQITILELENKPEIKKVMPKVQKLVNSAFKELMEYQPK